MRWEDRLTLFVGFLVQNNRQSSTVRSYISTMKAVLKENDIDIAEDQYLLSSLTRACRLKNDQIRTRLPIQKGMLAVLLRKLQAIYEDLNQPYLKILYSAMISTMYHGLLRVSEVTAGEHQHPVLAPDVHIGTNKKKFLLILRTSKTHTRGTKLQLVKISSKCIGSNKTQSISEQMILPPCPFELLHQYALYRGGFSDEKEPFFIFSDKTPVTPTHLRICLKKIIRNSGFDETLYSTHSLRIGRTCDLYRLGISVETIKKLGWWHSNAVFRYLRT